MIVKSPGSQVGSPATAKERGEESGGGGKKESMIDDVKSDDTKSEIKIQNSRGHEWSAEDCSKSARKIIVVGIVVIVIVSITVLARRLAYPAATSTFACTLASSLFSSGQEDGRRAEGLEKAL